jgi:hypothetical protein
MLNPSGERYIGLPVLNELNLNNGCNYNGPKEGKSVMNNVLAAELDYDVQAASTIKIDEIITKVQICYRVE